MSDRIILHCDLNNFFASVECLYKPELSVVPMAVCGSVENRHGIVLAKNELAKKYGVKTAEAIWQAKQKCPELVTVEPHYGRYTEFSYLARGVYSHYTDIIEPFGIDECWLDVSGSTMLFGSGEKIAQEIRRKIKRELGITISAGVSFNKVFAKLGSDMKKPDAVTVISKDGFREKIWPLPVEDMIGVGRSTKKALNCAGIVTLGDLARSQPDMLRLLLGKAGCMLYNFANGLDNSPVVDESMMPSAKSFGRSVTCREDLTDIQQVKRVMLELTEKVAHSLRKAHVMAGMVQISIRDSGLCVREHQCRLVQPTRLVEMLMDAGMQLFSQNWKWDKNIRSVGIRACELTDEDSCCQYSMFYDSKRFEKLERLEGQVELIRQRYGKSAIVRALLIPSEGNASLLPAAPKEMPASMQQRYNVS